MLGAKHRENSVLKDWGFQSWFKMREAPIGPPAAHIAAAIGMFVSILLAYVLGSMGYLSKTWSVVMVLAGYAIPFAIVRDRVAKRGQIKTEKSPKP